MSLWNCICCLEFGYDVNVNHTHTLHTRRKSRKNIDGKERKTTNKSIRKSNYHDLSFVSILQNFLDRMQSIPASKQWENFALVTHRSLSSRFCQTIKPVSKQYDQWRHTSKLRETKLLRERRAMDDERWDTPQTLIYDVFNMYECVFSTHINNTHTHTHIQHPNRYECDSHLYPFLLSSHSLCFCFSCTFIGVSAACVVIENTKKHTPCNPAPSHWSFASVSEWMRHRYRAGRRFSGSRLLAILLVLVLLPLQQQSFAAAERKKIGSQRSTHRSSAAQHTPCGPTLFITYSPMYGLQTFRTTKRIVARQS